MSDRSLDNVRERLLRAGLSPRHVRRYVSELRDHLDDLVARELAAGLGVQEAWTKARALLGSDTQLVQAMIDSGAPRSLAAKAPWAVFGLLPLVALVVAIWLLAHWAMAFFFPYRAQSGDGLPDNIRAIGLVLGILGNYVIGPALAAACIVTALRQRLSSVWVWMGLALIALASGPLGVHIHFLSPQGGMPGGIRGSSVLQVYEQGRIDAVATYTLIAARIAVLFTLSALAYVTLRQRAARRLYTAER